MNRFGWEYKKLCFIIFSCVLIFSLSGCFMRDFGDSANQSQLAGYPISSTVVTTLMRTIAAVSPSGSPVLPYELSKYKQNGFGNWTYGAGSPLQKKTDIIPAYNAVGTTNVARLLHFFTMSDIHLTDKESPAQVIYLAMFNSGFGSGAIAVYSGILLYTTHVLDAAVQTVNALHEQKPIDFGMLLGDAANNNQYNELRWYIDVLDGKEINPDSGAKDDPIPGPYNDYQDIYKAAGLNKTIPWYQAVGNHDMFWLGSKPVNAYLRSTYTGENILCMGNVLAPGGMDKRDYYMGVLDGRTVFGDIFGAGPVASFAAAPKIPADPDRHPLSSKEWMSEFFKTSTNPVGHGFNQTNIANDFACYSFEPKSDIPIKVIVLDDTIKENTTTINPSTDVYIYGTIDKARYDWLVSELQEGQTNNKLMIIAAHVPIGVGPVGSPYGWWKDGYMTDAGIIAELHKYPNLLMWISGHRHFNAITPFVSPVASEPERGFWGVETPSLREFPQQFRQFEIVRNSDKTISILAIDVDPAVKAGSFAETSRSYALAAAQLYGITPEVSRNAELLKQLSPAMQAKIASFGTPINN
ncbi:MAG: TIGR03768 family metallophosphoesterase [Candidatus Ozemobacteraceae bacterium]